MPDPVHSFGNGFDIDTNPLGATYEGSRKLGAMGYRKLKRAVR